MPDDEPKATDEHPSQRTGELDPIALMRWLNEAYLAGAVSDRASKKLQMRALEQSQTEWPLRVVIYTRAS